MSDSRKPNRHFLDERSVRQGKQNDKDANRGRKFDWRDKVETDTEEDNYDLMDNTGENCIIQQDEKKDFKEDD